MNLFSLSLSRANKYSTSSLSPMGTEPTEPATNGRTEDFHLVGHNRFVRRNPLSDRFVVHGFHHIEFWCADAVSPASRFSFALGAPIVSHSGLATGNLTHASYLLRTGSLQFLFTAPQSPANVSPSIIMGNNLNRFPPAAIPSFDSELCRKFSAAHGLAVRAIALHVGNAFEAFEASVAGGARPSFPPADLGNGFALSEVELYGHVVLRYVSTSSESPTSSSFLPGFEDVEETVPLDYGIRRLDHAVGNVSNLSEAVNYVSQFTGFHEFAEFVAEDVGTAESGLNSVVLANNDETVLIPMNEPVHGTKRRSQIQTYLDFNGGAGVQHLALASQDVIKTLKEMRKRSGSGGFEFMPPPPPTYYKNLHKRAGDVLTTEQIRECEELGILVDRDDEGVLLQIFTKPVGDRPTLFLEIIQRFGCMTKDSGGKEYQKGGCGGFGKGNFSELFKSIEEYEKSLEAKQQTAASGHS